ncbi:MAG: glycogen/starch/alpha-glucan phosphorylase, partial [Clostridia bacterium]|nr:glycogen/starch/alpha-glucan phosphorylase [Clostridia bacterium]
FHKKIKARRAKRVYYLCMEFLLGRSLKNSLYNLSATSVYEKAISSFGFSLEDLYELEPDAGLGNGGLGRLAACFMDALATGNYPALGYSLCYEFGLFKQKIVDGWQTELPDTWLPGGEAWLTQRTDKSFTVRFNGQVEERWTENGLETNYVNCKEVQAVAYDMMISGKDSEAVSVLRLWKARPMQDFNMKLFSQGEYYQAMTEENDADLLTKVLYPADNHTAGKSLRLKQQYFLCSASIQNIVEDHKHRYGDLRDLPKLAAIHLNDTHPAMAIAELMRILVDEYFYDWNQAWAITTATCAYTNHTILAEALETWSEDIIERTIPRIKMANLAIYGGHSVNGVSSLHSEIIKQSVFKDFYDFSPEKFTNVTNGIAHRRWLNQANPELAGLITDCIGEGFDLDASKLIEFKKFENDKTVLSRLEEIKSIKKKQFSEYARKKQGAIINPDTIFDVQAKRLHEYKRQLLNALNIIDTYLDLIDNPELPIVPKTYIFGAKAAPGYDMAKKIIKLINYLAVDIKKNPKINEKLNVVYMEDYNVTMSEMLMPASEVSEQISLAGKEASGTGNMKFMINGALTVGTLDGANVEMVQVVGDENIFIFGLKSNEVDDIWRSGYSPRLRRIIEALIVGFNGQSFADIANYLLTESPVADPYMCMADFGAYSKTQRKISDLYSTDKLKWNQMSLRNIAAAGVFAADRAIAEYTANIWKLKSIKNEK